MIEADLNAFVICAGSCTEIPGTVNQSLEKFIHDNI